MVKRALSTTLRLVLIAAASVGLLTWVAAQAVAAPPDTPEYAAGLVLGELATGNAADAWQSLHPAQQTIVSLQAYKACRAPKGTLDVDTSSTRLVKKSKERVLIPGTNIKAPSVALTIKVVLTSGQSQNVLVHEIRVKNSWRYILNKAEVAACRDS
jgi:hypothetical protein